MSSFKSRFLQWSKSATGKTVLEVTTVVLLLVLGWTSCWSVLGDECLPDSNIFGILVSCVCGKLLGMLLGLVNIPPLIGMIASGILFRNVPKINVAGDIDVKWSSALRTGAFVILLLRAGLGLRLDILRKNKMLVACLSVLPCVVEVIIIACVSRPLLDLPWNWAFLLGFVIAGVSPAVVIPSMLSLIDRGYGNRAGVPTLLMAAATADNAFTITGFSVALKFVFPESTHAAMVIMEGPIEVVLGGVCGVVLGYILSHLPPHSPHQASVQTLLLTMVGFSCVFGLKRATFAGAGVLAALVMSTVAAQTWQTKTEISASLQKLWLVGETLLFTLVGAQVELSLLNYKIVGYGVVCLIVGVLLRCGVAFLSVHCSSLHLSEKLFMCASWTPKATVQAAIGSIALDRVRETLPGDKTAELYGVTVLCVAVLAIIVTSPPGAALISLLGPRLLDFKSEEVEPIRVKESEKEEVSTGLNSVHNSDDADGYRNV
ncbi:sodium/hydrogen exchanger 9B2-like [Bolinopsis microptera]|uniref:sodium/hydrogen exchanger 9B2-like n=1 Tax=Bolinopsis microptera TaxID=2820187 RepID=UPI00307A9A4E